jgi:hypothetical protein
MLMLAEIRHRWESIRELFKYSQKILCTHVSVSRKGLRLVGIYQKNKFVKIPAYGISHVSRARILKHSMEAEKSIFREELSFQNFLCFVLKTVLWKQLGKHKIRSTDSTFAFFIENICRLIRKSWNHNHTFSRSLIWKSFRIRALNSNPKVDLCTLANCRVHHEPSTEGTVHSPLPLLFSLGIRVLLTLLQDGARGMS